MNKKALRWKWYEYVAHLLSCQSRLVCPFSYFWFALLTTTPFSTLGDILNSLQTETSISWYSAGGRKGLRPLPRAETDNYEAAAHARPRSFAQNAFSL